MKREFSAGGIVFKNNQVLLISNAAMKDPKKAYWGFPKGHLEEGETGKEAAVREVKEETGIEAKIIEKLGESKYIFTHNGEKIFKIVPYFSMEYVSGELKKQDLEILEVLWISPEEALKKLSFSQDKAFLKKAIELKQSLPPGEIKNGK